MGLRLTVKGADFSQSAIGYIAAVPSGLEYLNFFGGNAESLGRNLAPDKERGIVIGAPTVKDSSVVFTQMQHYIQTRVKDSAAKTIMAIGRSPDPTGQVMLVSNYRSNRPGAATLTNGVTLSFAASTSAGLINEGFIASHWDGSTPASSTFVSANILARPAGGINTLVARKNNNGGSAAATKTIRTDNKTANLFKETTFANAVFDLGSELRIGSGYLALNAVAVQEMFFVAIWDRFLSDAEVQAMYAQVSAYYLKRGINV